MSTSRSEGTHDHRGHQHVTYRDELWMNNPELVGAHPNHDDTGSTLNPTPPHIRTDVNTHIWKQPQATKLRMRIQSHTSNFNLNRSSFMVKQRQGMWQAGGCCCCCCCCCCCLHIKPFFLPNISSTPTTVFPDSASYRDTNSVVTVREKKRKSLRKESRQANQVLACWVREHNKKSPPEKREQRTKTLNE